jgi:hypothetical protein
MPIMFLGGLKKLEKCVLRTGIAGQWRKIENHQVQFRTNDGAILNWWESSGTITFQGQEQAIPKLKRAFVKVATKKGLLEGERKPDDEITDLRDVISAMAKLKRGQKRMRADAAELKRRQKRMRIEIAELKEAKATS